ncbi:ABC transporter permease [Candidatus Omnitrophota bacterium]
MKTEQINVVTYEPDNSLRSGCFQTFRQIYRELIESRWLTYQLFMRDFTTMYKQSFIGFLWIFIMPVLNVGIFALLGRSGIFNYGDISAPYPVFAILGISLWQVFSSGISSCGYSLNDVGEMILHINFSKKSLVIASIGKSLITFTIQMLLIVILLVIFRVVPSKFVFFYPLVALPIVIFALGLGLMISVLNAIVRDTGNLLGVILMLGMYGTPILYAKPTIGILANVTKYNPLYYFISTGRDLVLTGRLNEPKGFVLSCLLAVFVFLTGLFVFHLTETRIAERS